MYTSISDIFNTIQEKFSTADKLSKAGGEGYDCYYHHGYNGIGCAIGCLLPPDDAHQLDDGDSIAGILAGKNRHLVLRHFDIQDAAHSDRFIDLLTAIQTAHDSSVNVPAFLARLSDLRQFIESGASPYQWRNDNEQEF